MSNVNSCQKCGRDLTKLNQYNIKTHINLCKGTREMYLRPINNFFSKQSLSNMFVQNLLIISIYLDAVSNLIISNSTDYRVNVAYSDTTSDSNVSEDESDLDTDDIEKHPLN